MGRRLARLLGPFGAALLLAACGASPPAAGSGGDALAVSLSSDIRSTNPGVNRDLNTDHVMMHLFEGLVGYREDGTPGPLLAESVSVSPDGRTYRFRLRNGIRFHNGATMTPADVVWSWKRYLDPETGWVCLPEFDGTSGAKLLSVAQSGPAEVTFTLDRPNPMLLAQMAAPACGGSAILHPSSVNRDGSWRWPVATGPYRIGEWRRGRFVELERFDGYSSRPGPRDGFTGGKTAYAPRIRWLVIRDAAARLAALVKGQIDVMPEATTAELRRLQRFPQLRLESAPGAVINAILIQSSDPLLADVRIRRALMLAIDRRAVTKLATGDTGAPNASMIPAASSLHGPVHDLGMETNLAEAQRLLRAAGYRGQEIALTTNRRYADMFDQALLIQAMARKAGFKIRLEVTEWATQLNQYQTGHYQLMSFAYSARADPWLAYDSILGDRTTSKRKPWGSPAAWALLAKAGRETDPAKRAALFDELHRLMIADVPLIVLYNPADINVVRSDVEGFKSWPIARVRLWGVRKAARKQP